MKIKYRRFDDNDYTEVECITFKFQRLDLRKGTEFIYLHDDGHVYTVLDVCEVYIEEI